ncbi:hypothetical protein ELQ90_15835 [Labedella phragmitis]|uniref:Activator of Hsp90 ATPase homologue 1/2-like C-terminal domain-containing protein n=1 Tax=Labedella phragmitis TaxID=2498849 RepID=A0A444PP80_9MICO|nr:SRPBCC family protein [Labedella phragmitis]RWZ46238.1 hypothetical protein ELQ90_15835 [Labedella phragmitis]
MSAIENDQSVVDAGAFTVRRSIAIAAPLEKVWAAVTEPEHVSRWFGRLVLDGSGPGASGTISWPEHAPIPIRVEAVDAPRSISYSWGNDDASDTAPVSLEDAQPTVFTFTLESVSTGTLLTVVEAGFEATSDPLANLESHRQGWNIELDKLAALVEGEASNVDTATGGAGNDRA